MRNVRFAPAAPNWLRQLNVSELVGLEALEDVAKELDRVLVLDSHVLEVRRKTDRDFASWKLLQNGIKNFEQEAGTVFDAAAVLVGAAVG